MSLPTSIVGWFAKKRGIDRETLEHFGVTGDDKGEWPKVRIPYPHELTKIRIGLDEGPAKNGGKKFVWAEELGGSIQPLYRPPDEAPDLPQTAEYAIITEGESDLWALWQNMPEELRSKVMLRCMPGMNAWAPKRLDARRRYTEEFKNVSRVYVCLDNDVAYGTREDADKMWATIREDLGRKAKRVRLDAALVNDLSEFFMNHRWPLFEKLLEDSLQPTFHFKPVDWDNPVPPAEPLVESLIYQTDLNLLVGDGGTHKSWIGMSLAVAVAEEAEDWFGLKLTAPSPQVLYVDEESPPDVVFQRLEALGLTEQGKKNIHYLSMQGVRLDDDVGRMYLQDDFYELPTKPSLIVIDTFRRIHAANENDSGEMAQLMKYIQHYCRKEDVTVLVLHHTGRHGGSRGSSDLTQIADAAFLVEKVPLGEVKVKAKDGKVAEKKIDYSRNERTLRTTKPRRGQAGKLELEFFFEKDDNGQLTKAWFESSKAKQSDMGGSF